MNQQQQDFEKLFKERLEVVKFEIPKENAHHLIPIWKKLMDVSSLYHLDCDVSIYGGLLNELLKEKPEFNLFTVSFLLNALTRTSPKELGIPANEYHVYLFYSDDLSKQWNELVIPIRTELMNKLQTQAALQMPKNGKNVIPFKGR
ncbi:hypothetical protein C1637_09905 [Chryseobacterium lactis]|uniref:Uncharacterized protein n=1 Tax=Chryseobacterium lactis TaxID=1241981 RepID=A0A3G6RHR8_CHRLC|nr:hypothetical protein [Chryseobacterium lactis]AZA82176.1 hypothetical protein EG342_09795 [Chryseobacterium lactis]AZB02557.1 hypothetical protein EG341_00650 [Chryseobacterium lactis]PNW14148.1 hypothetical protein C1637_09905 [Chryseobacterium lactis]